MRDGADIGGGETLLINDDGSYKYTKNAAFDDAREVSNYVAAMNHGLRRLREDFPLSLRLIREIHEILLSQGRGQDKDPGAFRRTQNWIGGTRPGRIE